MSHSINLSKNQSVSLKKADGSSLKKVYMGLSWSGGEGRVVQETVKPGFLGRLLGQEERTVSHRVGGGSNIDLDSSVVCFDASGNVVDTVWFRQLTGLNGAIQHTGDDRSGGDGKNDNERINIDLSKVPSNVTALVFTVNSFTGETFDSIGLARCRLVDADNNEEKVSIDLAAKGKHKGVIMAKVYRVGSGWDIKSIAEIGNGSSSRTIDDLMPQIKTNL